MLPRRLLLAALPLVFSAALPACGDSDDGGADALADTGAGDTGGGADTGGTGEYPAGPYGVAVGDTIANLGFLDDTRAAITLGELRARTGVRALYVNTAAGWCTACREEQPALQAMYEELAASGLLIVVSYFEDTEFNPATVQGAVGWRDSYSLTFPVVADPDFVLSAYYDESQTPMNMVIDADSMRIVHISTGANLDEVRSVIGLLLR
jgi:thiol-disulfide isomerase/thioredoxin